MTKEKIIEKVKNHMKSIKLEFDPDFGIKCRDKELVELRDETEREVYSVSFHTPAHIERDNTGEITSLIEGYYCWCKVDATTFEILYYIKPHGYIEVDGTGHWI
jgi:hypothetical protein